MNHLVHKSDINQFGKSGGIDFIVFSILIKVKDDQTNSKFALHFCSGFEVETLPE